MDRLKYLERIGLTGREIERSISGLESLQRNHLLNVPFENLDIHWGTEITLDTNRFYKKIVESGRGGFCYELNGLFNELLKDLGFKTRIVSARVHGKEDYGPEYDHLAIVVGLEESEFLADVGFGDFSAAPLRTDTAEAQKDQNGVFRIEQGTEYVEVFKKGDNGWAPEYKFRNIERGLEEFSAMCFHNQTSPDSHFTHGKLCSLMTDTGRKSLTEKKFIVTVDGERTENEISDDAEFARILKEEFGIQAKDRQEC